MVLLTLLCPSLFQVRIWPRASFRSMCHASISLHPTGDKELQIDGRADLFLGNPINCYRDQG